MNLMSYINIIRIGSVKGGTDAVDKIPVARIVEALENPGGFCAGPRPHPRA